MLANFNVALQHLLQVTEDDHSIGTLEGYEHLVLNSIHNVLPEGLFDLPVQPPTTRMTNRLLFWAMTTTQCLSAVRYYDLTRYSSSRQLQATRFYFVESQALQEYQCPAWLWRSNIHHENYEEDEFRYQNMKSISSKEPREFNICKSIQTTLHVSDRQN